MSKRPSIATDETKAEFETDTLARLCALLSPLPSALRYYDEFDDSIRSIRNPADLQVFEFTVHGSTSYIDFSDRRPECATIFKHVLANMLVNDLSARTIVSYFYKMHHLTDFDVEKLVQSDPTKIGKTWAELRARELTSAAYSVAKHILQLLCDYRWNGWSPEYRDFLASTLPLPAADKYAGVRSGDVFLSIDEEALIVRYLDNMVERLSGSKIVSLEALADTGMLLCSYQFAMRPVQIGMLDMRHVRIWNDGISDEPTVHLTFHMAKQRGNKSRILLTRRVKREWVSIFTHLKTRLDAMSLDGTAKFFQAKSASEVGSRISTLVRDIISSEDIGTAMDLRHTAAQRLVDAGASHEELAEFMGHSQTNTGLVYYATSASHAERVNKALGASEVYRHVAKIAHDRFISHDDLAKLKADQQVAGVPHGIAIAGIGGCQSGQPSCPYNPVTSCYGCRKFMPVANKSMHEKVLSDMREVVLYFESSSRGDVKSPAYMQLQRTISEIQSVIVEIEESRT